eukprot:CAMPEP_0204566428 /NCGR_PEP_ID=MMETSP0661-20131031/36047_1 /ASSEMBLY_ACC=CAM_ASM_000606 /TAXON_ID=109239 /ORGANISM="Alexandrium margalefi, Strain AMGDE01CS-322" /LENGTH=61 /DNA_ID=CAMNT_0051574273 /DNA_START=44 /DNA_END=226 /DNA_ORIENTATION=+
MLPRPFPCAQRTGEFSIPVAARRRVLGRFGERRRASSEPTRRSAGKDGPPGRACARARTKK